MTILTIYWVQHYKGGIKWGLDEKLGVVFNWHPILMTLSLILLYGNGALIYRLIPPRDDAHKQILKVSHAVIMIIAFIVMVVGLQVRKYKK